MGKTNSRRIFVGKPLGRQDLCNLRNRQEKIKLNIKRGSKRDSDDSDDVKY